MMPMALAVPFPSVSYKMMRSGLVQTSESAHDSQANKPVTWCSEGNRSAVYRGHLNNGVNVWGGKHQCGEFIRTLQVSGASQH